MNLIRLARPFVVLSLLVPYALAAAQDLGIMDAIKGAKLPTSMKAADLTDEYKAVKLKFQGANDMSDLMSSPLMMMGMTMSGGHGPGGAEMAILDLMDALGASWTKGEQVRVGDHAFLVTYKADFGIRDMMSMNPEHGGPGELTLKLNLIRVDTITGISPMPELTKERLLEVGQGPKGMAATVPESAMKASAKSATLSNAKQMSLGLIMYCADYDDVLPYAQGTRAVQFVTYPYVKNAEIWKTLNPNGGEFRFNMAVSGISAVDVDEPASMPMFYESLEWPDGTRVVAFMDGHVKAVTREEWRAMQKYMTMKIRKAAKRPLPLSYGMDWSPAHPSGG